MDIVADMIDMFLMFAAQIGTGPCTYVVLYTLAVDDECHHNQMVQNYVFVITGSDVASIESFANW